MGLFRSYNPDMQLSAASFAVIGIIVLVIGITFFGHSHHPRFFGLF
jgi:hypothetical protein